ncbi:MAG: hypothetical protein ACYTHM_09145, partial [Planctomycetota bacterium]|jgi:hypothetical protein
MTSVASRILSVTLFPPYYRNVPQTEGNWTGLVSFSSNFDAVGYRLFNIDSLLGPYAAQSRQLEQLYRSLSYGHDWGWSLLIILALSAVALAVIFWRLGRPGERVV